jgi:O-antigen/teichoic acid export membrane protein
MAWVGLFAGIFSASLGTILLKEFSDFRDNSLVREQVLGAFILIFSIMSLLGASAFYFVSEEFNLVPSGNFRVLCSLFLPVAMAEGLVSDVSAVTRRAELYLISRGLIKLVALVILAAGLYTLKWGVFELIFWSFCSSAAIVVVCAGSIAMEFRPRFAGTRPYLTNLVRSALLFHPSNIGSLLVQRGELILIDHALGSQLLAQYQLARQILQHCLVGVQAASPVIIGRIATEGADNAWISTRKLSIILLLVTFGGTVGALFLAQPLFGVLFGDRFLMAGEIFIWMTPLAFSMAVSWLVSSQWVARGLLWQLSAFNIISGILHIVPLAVLLPVYGLPVIKYLLWFNAAMRIFACLYLVCKIESSLNRSGLGLQTR